MGLRSRVERGTSKRRMGGRNMRTTRSRLVYRPVRLLVVLTAIVAVRGAPALAASVTVNCTADPGALAGALSTANDGDTLSIQGTCKGTFEITQSLTLAGSDGATLDGQSAGTVLKVDPLTTVNVNNLTITGGNAVFGGGIHNLGTLTLMSTTV